MDFSVYHHSHGINVVEVFDACERDAENPTFQSAATAASAAPLFEAKDWPYAESYCARAASLELQGWAKVDTPCVLWMEQVALQALRSLSVGPQSARFVLRLLGTIYRLSWPQIAQTRGGELLTYHT